MILFCMRCDLDVIVIKLIFCVEKQIFNSIVRLFIWSFVFFSFSDEKESTKAWSDTEL